MDGAPLVARFSEKTLYEAYLLWIPPFGLLGGHHYYLRRYLMGVMYTFTLGFFGIGLLVDLFRMPMLVREANAERRQEPKPGLRSIADAYLFWVPPFGLLGAHHFYLGRYIWGTAYIFTLGFFGLGYLFDLVYIPFMVRSFNDKINKGTQCDEHRERSLVSAYVLALPPSGLFGSHQLYLKNYFMFAVYTWTLGLFGIGWFVDLFRMPVLVRRCRERLQGRLLYQKVYADDAYVLLLPFGLLGMHHFYLRRYAFGFIYLFTLGLGGLGLLVDLFLIPTYVKRSNAEAEERLRELQLLVAQTQHQRRLQAAYGTVAAAQQYAPPQLLLYAGSSCPAVPPPHVKAGQADVRANPSQVRGSYAVVPPLMPAPVAAPPPSYYGDFQPAALQPAYGAIRPPPYSYESPVAGSGSGRMQQ